MVERPKTQDEHDDVIRASAGTYSKMKEKGFRVSINPNGEKNHGWPDKDLYPDIVVWKPSEPGSGTGQAEIIEEIETEESVNYDEAKQWKRYAKIGVKFLLIVPENEIDSAREIIQKEDIGIDEIWIYYYDNDQIKFRKEEL